MTSKPTWATTYSRTADITQQWRETVDQHQSGKVTAFLDLEFYPLQANLTGVAIEDDDGLPVHWSRDDLFRRLGVDGVDMACNLEDAETKAAFDELQGAT